MRIFALQDDFPGIEEVEKLVRRLSSVAEKDGFSSPKEAMDWYMAQDKKGAIIGLDSQKKNIRVKTFGNFEVFLNGETVSFKRARAKEVLAYLVDKQGTGASRAEIYAAIYEDEEYERKQQKSFDVVISSLKSTLSDYGISDIIEINDGSIRIIPEKIKCDLYDLLEGDEKALAHYRGEYMSAYPWSMMTEAYIDQHFVNKGGKSVKTDIYTLDLDDLKAFGEEIPDKITANVNKPGFFTIGAVGVTDGDEKLVGMSQFYIDITSEGECFANLMYVFVVDGYRRQGVGTKLVDKVNNILKKSEIKMCIARVPEEKSKAIMIPLKDFEKFLKESDFFITKEEIVGETEEKDKSKTKKYIRMTRR